MSDVGSGVVGVVVAVEGGVPESTEGKASCCEVDEGAVAAGLVSMPPVPERFGALELNCVGADGLVVGLCAGTATSALSTSSKPVAFGLGGVMPPILGVRMSSVGVCKAFCTMSRLLPVPSSNVARTAEGDAGP